MKKSITLLILIAVVIIALVIRSRQKKQISNTHSISRTSEVKNKTITNKEILNIDSSSWSSYSLEKDGGNVFINRNGTYPLKVRWKTTIQSDWQYGNWLYENKSDFYGIHNIKILEFRLPNDFNKQTLEVYQKKSEF